MVIFYSYVSLPEGAVNDFCDEKNPRFPCPATACSLPPPREIDAAETAVLPWSALMGTKAGPPANQPEDTQKNTHKMELVGSRNGGLNRKDYVLHIYI